MKAWLLIKYPTIPEEFFLGLFIEGLKEDIRHIAKILDPYSLSHAVEKARHKENLIDTMAKKNKFNGVRSVGQYQGSNLAAGNKTVGNSQKEGTSNTTLSGTKLFEARKARGECYKYGEKYFSGHVCKNRQLNTLSGSTEQEEEITELITEGKAMPNGMMEEILDEAISLNGLSGTITSTIIKLRGLYGKKMLTILADSRNTNSFIASETAKHLGCIVEDDAPMGAVVANGGYLMSYQSCPQFS